MYKRSPQGRGQGSAAQKDHSCCKKAGLAPRSTKRGPSNVNREGSSPVYNFSRAKILGKHVGPGLRVREKAHPEPLKAEQGDCKKDVLSHEKGNSPGLLALNERRLILKINSRRTSGSGLISY